MKTSGDSLTVEKIRTVVKEAVEDKSCNLMIFGLPEGENEKDHELSKSVKCVLDELELEEKPSFSACRIGRAVNSKPVKVTFRNSQLVQDLLKNAKTLKNSDNYSKVYLRPDRTEEQRKNIKNLLED